MSKRRSITTEAAEKTEEIMLFPFTLLTPWFKNLPFTQLHSVHAISPVPCA